MAFLKMSQMCIVCIPNNIIRNVYIYLNFSDYGLRTSVVIHVYKARARRNGYLDDRIKRSLTFLKSQNLYTMHWAMFVFCILCDAWTAICRFLLHSASQTYFVCVILSIYTIYGLEKPYVMFKCQFQSKLG